MHRQIIKKIKIASNKPRTWVGKARTAAKWVVELALSLPASQQLILVHQ